MFNEIYEEVLKLGRVMRTFPQGYKLTDSTDVIASVANIIDLYTDRSYKLYYMDTFNNIKIALAYSDMEDPSRTIVADTWLYLGGEPTHVMVFNYNIEKATNSDLWLTLTTIILSLTIATMKSSLSANLVADNINNTIMNTVNLYSTLIMVVEVLSTFGATDKEILAHVRAAYNSPVRDNITPDTITSTKALCSDRNIYSLLDNSMIYYIMTNTDEDEFPGLDITPKANQQQEAEGEDNVEALYEELSRDVIPFRYIVNGKRYNALAYEGDLSEYINDPKHYIILYIRTNDDGSGDWATFEDRPVRVNNGGTILLSSRCDLSSLFVHDDESKTQFPANYIIVDPEMVESVSIEDPQLVSLHEDPASRSFEDFVTWVDILPGEDNETN